MKALTFGGVRNVHYQQVDDPTPRAPGDAVVRVDLAAICGSDLHVYHGRETGLDAATVMGHEFIGRVAATGKAVTRFAEGDRVVAPFTTSCGDCFFCRSGLGPLSLWPALRLGAARSGSPGSPGRVREGASRRHDLGLDR